MASENHGTLVVVLLLSFLSLLCIEVEAVDDVYISDEFNGRFTDKQNAFVEHQTNHTFQCLASSTRPTVTMRWELFDGNSGRFLNHSEGYPITDSGNTVGQIWFYTDFGMTDHVLRCRVEDDHNIIDSEKVFKVQVPPENVVMFDSDEPDGYQPDAVVTLTQGKEHSVQCLVRATTTDCNIAWTIDDKVRDVISVNEDDSRLVDTTSTTSFTPQRSHHKTFLECSASIRVPNIGDIPSPPVSIQVQLEVNGPPDTPRITGSSSQVEDVTFQIQCHAFNAFPPASLRWYLDNSDITISARETTHPDVNGRYRTFSTLTYTLSRVHNQHEFRCDARHPTLSSPLQSSNYKMNVAFCPTSITLYYSETQSCPSGVVAGKTVTLTCISSSSNPNSTILWYANEQEQPSQYFPTYQRSDNNGWATQMKYTSHPFTQEDVGIQIKCCTHTDDCSPALCSDLCMPDVYYVPVFQRIEIPQDIKLEGESALLTCDVSARPQPNGFVKWQKDETIIKGSFDQDEDGDGGRLIYNIQEITRHDAGTYMCVADNGIGSSSSQPKNLTVIYKPNLLEKQNPKNVYEGNRVELIATIRSNPVSVVNWISPTGPIPPYGDDRYDIETSIEPDGYEDSVRGTIVLVKLALESVSRSNDTGNFICNVTNSEGDLQVTFTIEVGNKGDFSLIIISSCSAVAGIFIVAVVGMLIFYKRKNCSTRDLHSPKLGRNDKETDDDSFDENIYDEEPAVYVNTAIEPAKPKSLPAPPSPYMNMTIGSAKEIDDNKQDTEKIKKPLPMPNASKRQQSGTNPKSDENSSDYNDSGQNDRKQSVIYDSVTPGVPDVVPMKQMAKVPLKPPSIALTPPTPPFNRKDQSKPSEGTLQFQLAKALERRNTNDTNV